MRIGRKTRYVLLAALVIPVLAYLALIAFASRVGPNPGTGLALLDTSGAGYAIGDVVWLKATQRRFDLGDAVLVDWRQAEWTPGAGPGLGPPCALRRVVALPGEVVGLGLQGQGITVRGTTVKGYYHWAALQRSGLSIPGNTRLEDDLLLLLEDTGRNPLIIPVRLCHIKARVCFKVGHDPIRARRLRNIRY